MTHIKNNMMKRHNDISRSARSILMLLALFIGTSNAAWADTWNGTTTTDLRKQSHNTGNDGKTEATAWEISTAGEFAWFMKQVAAGSAAAASKTYGNKYWKLTADIDLNNKEWNAYGSSTSVFLGHFDGGGHTISNMTIEPVKKKKTYSGLFGNISGTDATVRSEVKNLTIANSSFDPTAGFSSKSCGFLCGYSIYADITNVTVTGCAFNMGDNQFSGSDNIGGVVGQTGTGVIIRNCTVTGFTLGCAAKVKGLNLGGIAGYCNASSTLPTTIEGCSVNTPTFTMGTATTINELNGCNIGGLVGSCGAGLNIYDNKVSTPQMTIYAKVTSASYIAGGIGVTGSYSNIDGLHISGGYIKDALASGAKDFIPVTANVEFVVAGAISKVNNGGTSASGTANVVKNVAVTDMKFDLPHHNAATGVTNTNKFVVGAVMGYISEPGVDPSGRCAIPENIVSKGVTLYAPYAITSAVVGTSGTAAGIDNYHDDGRNSLDQIQKSQHDTWFYSDYRLGLSNDVLTNSNIIEYGTATEQTAKVERNYLSSSVETNTDADISAPKLLNMTSTTFQHKPGYSDHEFDGGTVLWWNQSGGTANDNTQQGFYPLDGNTGRLCSASCGVGGNYPYFMYFFQGVNHGTYVEPAAATNIIAGIDANYTLMYKDTTLATPTILTISDPDGTAKKRGFDAHVISVTASDGGSYTYKWYVNGVEQSETGTSISVKPDWRYSKSIMVQAVSGDNVVGSTSYTLRHGMLKTKNPKGTDYVGMSYADRGTSENPYIIDCPEALKQWSYLSTYCTAYNYEGTQSGATVAFNQSYFELGADIDLGTGTSDEERAANPGELIPIGHCGWSQDGTRGTINQNFVFCGHFEGNGHAIKNFKIKWKGATTNNGGKYIYYGLFGALGWGESAATQSCVVQNLILENGRIVHDNTNHSLYYEGTTHTNNVCIGMLAGIASQYTTVRNVELRNCSIDDNEDTEDYYLAEAQLTVGGMIGRIQGSTTANNLDFGSTIVTNFLSSNCDITLKHAAYKSRSTENGTFEEYDTNSTVRLFTVGGVIGSIYNVLAAFSASNMPKYIYYTGKIDARRAFVAPVFASADYSGITGNNYEDYWKHFMVNAKENTSQDIPNLYYGKFQIQDYTSSEDGTTQTITNSYPASTCSADGGSRTIVAHNNAHPNTYAFYTDNNNYFGAYQGVNYGTLVASGDRAALELEIAAAKNSIEEISSWYLVFDGDQLQLTDHMPEKLSLQDFDSGNTHTLIVTNTAADADAYSYEWYINGVKSEEIASTTKSVDFTTGATPQLIYVKAIKDGTTKQTNVVDIPRGITNISATYYPVRVDQLSDDFDGVFTVTPDDNALTFGGDNLTYVWKEFKKAYQETKTYTEETAWAANQPHILSFKDKSTGADVDKADWTYTKSVSSDYTVEYGDTVVQNITESEYTDLDATEQAKCTANGDEENTYSYTHIVSYTPVTSGQEYTVYHTGEYIDLKDDTTYSPSGETSSTKSAYEEKTYQCTITATDAEWNAFLADATRTSQYSSYSTDLSKLYTSTLTYTLIVRLKKNVVVWLHPNSTTEEYGIPAGKDKWTIGSEGGVVGDKTHPVRTWGKAYSLLDGSEGVDWDFNKIVLVGTSDALTTNGFGASPGEGEHGNGTGETYSLGDVSWYGLSNVFSEGDNGLQKTSSAPSYDVYMADIARSPMAKNVTITGKYDGVDYHGAITSPQIISYDKAICGADVGDEVKRWFNMLGDTKFEYLTFIGCKDAFYDSFFGHYHDIWFGEGLIMKNFCGDSSEYGTIATISTPRFDIWGGLHNDERFSLYDGKQGELLRMQEQFMPHGKKGFTMTFRSGYYSIICTGSRETESVGIQGSPNMPIKCTVDVDLDQDWNNQGDHSKPSYKDVATPYDVGIILSGNHEGPMFADIDISVKSGRVARVVNGSLGANTPSSYIYGNGKLSYPYNNFMGRTNMVLEPAKSRFAQGTDNDSITNARVVVTEVYNGSIGRSWADSKQEIDMSSLGDFNITMNGGTIGFPHTTDYWTDTDLDKLKASNQVYCGIYGGGAGGMIGIGYGDYDDTDKTFLKPHSYTKEQFLPYWDSKDHLCPFYSPYSLYKQYIAKDDPRHLFIQCYNADTDDYTYVDPADTKSVITINGGVIGSADKPGNIFGAGSGFTSTWFLRQSNYPNLTSGAIYGTSKDDNVVTLNIKGNTVIYGNVYGAGKGTDYYYTHYYSSLSTQVYSGSTSTAQNFTFLGQTYGSAVVNISGSAVIHGNVYGGGAGVAEAKFVGSDEIITQMTETALLAGNATVNISENSKILQYTYGNKTYGGNVYGGGMLARVEGDTHVNISGNAKVSGAVFGAAQGITNITNEVGTPQSISGTVEETYNLYNAENATLFGRVLGSTYVNTSGSAVIGGNIYGGAESAITEGNANVTINGGAVNDIFGGGLGSLSDDKTTETSSADIKGNTSITVNGGSYNMDGEDADNIKSNHNIYGGGNTVSQVAGTTTVTLNHGLATKDMLDATTDAGKSWTAATKDSEHPRFSVFGGGYGSHTTVTGVTTVNAKVGNKDSYADAAAWKESEDAIKTLFDNNTGNPTYMMTYGFGKNLDASAYRRLRIYEYAHSNGVPGHVYQNIYGGGYSGYVTSTSVNVSDHMFCNNVYGGGLGSLPEGTPAGTETYGQVSGNTNVNINGGIILNNIYGGGAGISSVDNDVDGTFDIDFTEMARVKGSTNVTIDGTCDVTTDPEHYTDNTIVYGYVYGGGDIANVGTAEDETSGSNVVVKGGMLMSQVLAGGNGRLASKCMDYATLGSIYGNTSLSLNGETTSNTSHAPWLYNSIYGGCENGVVYGNTTVTVNGGFLGGNIFGGGWGNVAEDEPLTSADVKGSTTVKIDGGLAIVADMWNGESQRTWQPVNTGTTYTMPQYDPETKKLRSDHNIFGGGNTACTIGGNTTVTINRGLLAYQADNGVLNSGTSFFESKYWKAIYDKKGSSNFCVFGGGYGEKTVVTGDALVDVEMYDENGKNVSDLPTLSSEEELYKHMLPYQSVMDVVGGGFSGSVTGTSNVTVGTKEDHKMSLVRRIYGGGYFNSVGHSQVNIASVDCNEVYGGGMMGDVLKDTHLTIDGITSNDIYVHGNVYGGNDVTGNVNLTKTDSNGKLILTSNEGDGTNVTINGCNIDGNVYGAGNGNYLYALDPDDNNTKVTTRENYQPSASSSTKYDLVYTVPMYDASVRASDACDALKMININLWRPLTNKVSVNVAGTSAEVMPVIKGNVFGGGNSATVKNGNGETDNQIIVNIGDYVNIGGVFLGNDGDELFKEQTENSFMSDFQTLNNINLENEIDWNKDGSQITETFLEETMDERKILYPHLLDLYFQPVSMTIQPVAHWNGSTTGDVENATIGTYVCGGNRSNVDVAPGDDGLIDVTFPAGLTITDKIVGGCNNSNYILTNANTGNETEHVGGYLLGSVNNASPIIKLNVKCKMKPTITNGHYEGGNVFGGCYESGNVNGNIEINYLTNGLTNATDATALKASNEDNYATCSVYGAGYGSNTYVKGNTKILFGNDETGSSSSKALSSPLMTTSSGSTDETKANNVYGGGLIGNVVGNTLVRIYNGTVNGSVVGGSYSGNLYGSTQVLVGYPSYYETQTSGVYNLLRVDNAADNLALKNSNGEKAVKQTIHLVKGDIVSEPVYDAIVAKEASQASNFSSKITKTPSSWDDVNITIGTAVYGGGYSVPGNSRVVSSADNTLVLKYNKDFNNDEITIGYGGNTTMLIADDPNAETEHITISSQEEDSNEGGIFGDGHLSYTEGFRSAEVTGYGYAEHTSENAKLLNTFQRMDMLRLTDNCLRLGGARDYATKATDKTLFSISRVGEIQMVSSVDDGTNIGTGSALKSRNYMGLANNTHYLGAIKTNTEFSSAYWHDSNGDLLSTTTYQNHKQTAIDNHFNSSSSDEGTETIEAFRKRNEGTAKNLIGVASGHYLKVENVQEKANADGTVTDNTFYGPIVGVAEVYIKGIRSNEAGGFVYADNQHNGNFLETSGNFVFQKIVTDRYIVDDCYPRGYGKVTGATAPAHYWYLDGYHYYHHVNLTAQTKKTAAEWLGMDDINMQNLSAGKTPEIVSLQVTTDHSNDPADYTSDLETRNYNANAKDKSGNLLEGKYQLWASISGKKTYTEDEAYKKLTMNAKAESSVEGAMTGVTTDNSDNLYYLNFKLVDEADNTSSTYYNAYLSKPTKETITLRVQAKDPDDTSKPLMEYQSITSLYADKDGKTEVNSGFTKSSSTTYYYKNSNSDAFEEAPMDANGIIIYQKVNDEYTQVTDVTKIDFARTSSTEYYVHVPVYYVYTVYLNIDYELAPSPEGNITIANCALPGERIKFTTENVKIESDPGLAPNAYYWRIGKLNADGTDFEDNTIWAANVSGAGYDSYKVGSASKDASGVFKGCVSGDDNSLTVPVYYYMNGYGVQFGFTVSAFGNQIFPVPMSTVKVSDKDVVTDKLIVHNYQLMDPHSSDESTNLHLPEAVARAKYAKENPTQDNFPEPRIYITDVTDLNAFVNFLDTVGEKVDTVKIGTRDYGVPRYGANAQFVIMNDMTLPSSYNAGTSKLAGTVHGNGHIISGLAEGSTLIGTNAGNIYNLGMTSGKIAATNNGKYHCCYEYEGLNVWGEDGSILQHNGKSYTDDDFHYGRVAYDLNQYYINKRLATLTGSEYTDTYVEDYFRNGDYQYACRNDEYTGNDTGIRYLRVGSNDTPNYGSCISAHDTNHTVDAVRAVYSNGVFDHYQPLFNESSVGDTSGETYIDYLYFGHNLQETPANYPATIISQKVSAADNRVWRAAGYYGSKTLGDFYYNGSQNSYTYVHMPNTTAIDFAYQDADYYADNSSYFKGFGVANTDVTKNLLVYTGEETASKNDAYYQVNKALAYDEDTDESSIIGHQVACGNSVNNASFLHLVDKNEFNAPKAFTVTGKAWYVRNPENESGYVEDVGKGWETICLPFTVKESTLSYGIQMYSQDGTISKSGDIQKNITFFYGTVDEGTPAAENMKTLHHEYWLRGLESVAVADSKTQATFKRPDASISDGGFAAYTPYIVSFPGSRFYEFDMTGQSVEFSNPENASIAVTDDAIQNITKNGITFHPAFANMEATEENYAMDLIINNDESDGSKFEKNKDVYAFRAYLTGTYSSESKGSSFFTDDDVIYINTGINNIEEINEEGENDNSDSADGLKIYNAGHGKIGVESTYATSLNVYSASGQLYRILDVRPGTATYSGFVPGIYIIDNKKMYVK